MFDKALDIIDGIELDKDNTLFFDAAKLVLETDKQLIYLTGKAGTGKTTFLKYIREKYDGNIIVLAYTGVAAVNANGQTIHSFFKLDFAPYPPNDTRLKTNDIFSHLRYGEEKLNVIKNMQLLIIDEVSMVRCDILDAIDRILRIYRGNKKPFGGVQILLIGDIFQLSPIAEKDWHYLHEYYDSPFFFSAHAYNKCDPMYLELDKIYRQEEQEFKDILNKIRVNDITSEELDNFNKSIKKYKSESNEEPPILLAPINSIVSKYNNSKFEQLESKIHTFTGVVTGIFPQTMMRAEQFLSLKVGAQVMILRNKKSFSEQQFEYYNGSIGRITNIDSNEITVELADKSVRIEQATWENREFIYDQKQHTIITNIIGTYTQFPLKLAWAITIHKSQGLTFNHVIADLSECFNYGQVYVALSRCRKLSGLHLASPISKSAIKADPKVLEFAKTKTPQTIITNEINAHEANNLYRKAIETFERNEIDSMFDYLRQAIKKRDYRDTPKFKQFVRIKVNQLFKYKRDIEIIQQAKEELESEKNKEIGDIITENIALEEHLKETIDENHEMLTIIQQGHIKMETQSKKIQQQQQKIDDLINENENYDKKIRFLERVRKEQKQEIERLRSLTWWQKLRGLT